VLLLAGAGALVALAPAQGPGDGPDGLEGALARAHAALSRALDLGLADAVGTAARAGAGDLSSLLDAALLSRLSGAFPMRECGLVMELEDARAALVSVPSPDTGDVAALRLSRPEGRACLVVEGAGGRIRAEVVAAGACGRPAALAARASAALGALDEPGGGLGYAVRASLWELAQGRALAGERDAGALLTVQDIEGAVLEGLRALCEGTRPEAPAPPAIDLDAVVRQSVEGAVRASAPCLGDYLGLGEGLGTVLEGAGLLTGACALPGDGLEDAVARALADLVVGALGDAEASPPAEGAPTDLTGAVASALAALDAMASRLDAVPAWAVPLARMGLMSAREALLAVGAGGPEVGSARELASDGNAGAASVGLVPSLAGLSIAVDWTGESACEPGRFLRMLSTDGDAPTFGALPYLSACTLRLRGDVRLDAGPVGDAPGEGAPASPPVGWNGGLALGLDVRIATGWPLTGVAYEPSRTLASDLADAARAVWGEASDGLGRLAARVRDAGEWVASQLQGIARDMVTAVLDESAYTLSRSLFSIGGSLLRGRTDAALNATWRLLSRVAGPVLEDRLTWRFDVLGLDATVSLDPLGQSVSVAMERGAVCATLEVRRLADARNPFRARPLDGHAWAVFGRAAMDLGRESVVVELDPLTIERASVLTATARWGDDGRGGPSQELVVEAVSASPSPVETGVRLRDLLGGAAALSAAGAVGMVDAGLVMRSERDAPGDLGWLALAALERAWLASVKGQTVGSLAGATASRPDVALFAETMLRELYFALLLEATGVVTEVEAFVEVDPPAPGWPKVHVGLVLADPLDVLLPLAVWAGRTLGRLAGDGATASPDGAGAGLPSALASRVLLRVELLWTVALPPFLASGGAPPQVGLAVRMQSNVAALRSAVAAAGALAGARATSASGGWEASASVELRGVPAAALAAWPGLAPSSWGWADVVLLRARLRDASAPLLLLSQVLYDASGTDADLEFVEILNAGDRVVDAGGLVLEDDDGGFVLPPHRPVMPGGRLLVARDRAAPFERWGVHPDVWGMGLRLANDGDVVRLGDGEGRTLDEVAWEGFVPGWERLSAGEGEALLRLEGRTGGCDPGSWTVGAPRPARGGGL
jgi:hypothetical protein